MIGEVLTQAEINQLISDLSSQGTIAPSSIPEKQQDSSITITEPEKTTLTAAKNQKIKTYDFRIPEKFSRYHIHASHAINEIFARLASTALSVYLKAKVEIEVASVDQMTYEEYSKSIVVSSVNTVFSMEPLAGRSVIQFNLSVIFTAIDRLLGGPGWSVNRERELTDLERTLIEGLISKVLSVFKESWANVIDINPVVELIECNPMFLPRIASPKETVLLGTFEIKISETSGIMSICIPYNVMEPILSRFSSTDLWASKDNKEPQDASNDLNARKKALDTLPMPIVVELGTSEISLRELLMLEPGNIICLNKSVSDDLDIKLMGVKKFIGRPGLVGDSVGVSVSNVLKETEEEIDFAEFEY